MSEILNRVFFNEVKRLADKYKSISDNQKEMIQNFLQTMEVKGVAVDEIDNIEQVLRLSSEGITDEELSLYKVIGEENLQSNISIQEAKDYYYGLRENGYVMINNKYLIYEQDKNLRDFLSDQMEELLADKDYIDKVFTKDEIIEFWVNETSREEAKRKLINESDIDELIDVYLRKEILVGDKEYVLIAGDDL